MKTHPGVLANTPTKAQTNDSVITEDQNSHSANKNQQEEKQGSTKSPEKSDSTDPLSTSAVSSAADEPMDTTA